MLDEARGQLGCEGGLFLTAQKSWAVGDVKFRLEHRNDGLRLEATVLASQALSNYYRYVHFHRTYGKMWRVRPDPGEYSPPGGWLSLHDAVNCYERKFVDDYKVLLEFFVEFRPEGEEVKD